MPRPSRSRQNILFQFSTGEKLELNINACYERAVSISALGTQKVKLIAQKTAAERASLWNTIFGSFWFDSTEYRTRFPKGKEHFLPDHVKKKRASRLRRGQVVLPV